MSYKNTLCKSSCHKKKTSKVQAELELLSPRMVLLRDWAPPGLNCVSSKSPHSDSALARPPQKHFGNLKGVVLVIANIFRLLTVFQVLSTCWFIYPTHQLWKLIVLFSLILQMLKQKQKGQDHIRKKCRNQDSEPGNLGLTVIHTMIMIYIKTKRCLSVKKLMWTRT